MREEVEEVAIEVELMRKVSADRHVTYGIDHCRNCHKVSRQKITGKISQKNEYI